MCIIVHSICVNCIGGHVGAHVRVGGRAECWIMHGAHLRSCIAYRMYSNERKQGIA